MKKDQISFYGYNDGKAIEIYNCINLFLPTAVSTVVSLVLSVLAAVFRNPCLLAVWVFPVILYLSYLLCVLMTPYNYRVFLSGARKKHTFLVDQGTLLRDGKPIRKDSLKVYAFRNFVFLITPNTYYRIPNADFIGISREEFLRFMKTPSN